MFRCKDCGFSIVKSFIAINLAQESLNGENNVLGNQRTCIDVDNILVEVCLVRRLVNDRCDILVGSCCKSMDVIALAKFLKVRPSYFAIF